MTIQKQNWTNAYKEALQAEVDELHATKQVPGSSELMFQYSDQIAEDMYREGKSPEEAAHFAAMSLVRKPLIDEIQKLTIKRRFTTNPDDINNIDNRLQAAKEKYNEVIGRRCFEGTQSSKKTLTEGVELPNMICFGRGYGENANPMDTSVISRFNSLVARNDPYTGGINPILARTQQYETSNASRYSVDTEPELDKYVDTVFIDDMGPDAYTINGENPYRVLDKIRAGEDVNIPVSHGVAARPNLPAVVKETQVTGPGYEETFDEIFSLGN